MSLQDTFQSIKSTLDPPVLILWYSRGQICFYILGMVPPTHEYVFDVW